MSGKKIKAPAGMLEAARRAECAWLNESSALRATTEGCSRLVLEAALLWFLENPIIPNDRQMASICEYLGFPDADWTDDEVRAFGTEWQRRMFLAPERGPVTLEEYRLKIDDWLQSQQCCGRRVAMVGTNSAHELLHALGIEIKEVTNGR